MDDLVKLFRAAYEAGVQDGRQVAVNHRMIGRKEFDAEFGIKVDAFDKHYRNKNGFPKPEGDGKWYAPAVSKWLMDHQQLNN